MFEYKKIALAVSLVLMTTACSDASKEEATTANAQSQTATSENTTQNAEQTESEKANKLFEDIFMENVMRSPMYQSYLGIKEDQDKWDDISEAAAEEELALQKEHLEQVKAIDESKLNEQTKISWMLMKQKLENEIADYKWRHHNYPVNQMFGMHSSVASLLINQHGISELDDAQDYIARLNGLPGLFDQLAENLELRAEKGIIAPKFVYPYVISDSKNIITGAPFDDGEPSALWKDFTSKVEKLELEESQREELLASAEKAMLESVKPAYEGLITAVEGIAEQATTKDGAWKFPDGEAFYNNALKRTTTTDLTAEEIHEIGLSEMERIHEEMRGIMEEVGFEGTLQEFFVHMRNSEEFVYPNTEEGRKRYLDEATAYIDNMRGRLDELFIKKPKADLIVKAVEPFREKSAGKAFYQQPSMDGTRPGTYYANLYDMAAMPTYQMEALAYHEGIPGHHMQIAIQQELEGIPKFRRFGRYTAYSEGWGLYTEKLPKEIGLYKDPYSDFGRLAMELWRAVRLVVDTGIHDKKWTREEGIDFYVTNTPNAKSDAVKMVERHIVMPSQATAYKIGMNKILELREKAKSELGDKFDIREFHDVVLGSGPVPLNILEQFVNDYISETKSS
ncbi:MULTISPECIES: DUF885 domain-containing protein [Idiomarina]|uniref:DUF885 domain-containing protein n=1 Tax=Idiomarina abyssalis TaxID=86102 RepID=A0A8I1KI30_9GAMM|nr:MULTISPECIES: DUF885 domain-containing protein [Idiomarina]RDX34412.1 DUF885 domain-containing protein [Idiomarina sp. HD9-110m-PIT-SAG05]MBJ7265896.1 DUF885 domain-containing protein [Idiomarina abyssalis]MBJ7273460.1 DUF885 domain-containing protein [Idiomarina abyssalis]MBJ7314554.1 DUF885 domain-containing protein [Idiomarina abyssalis]MBP58227.1 DUF885 domain-containing protein [Idiomarina sp.]|tara:strand:- start:1948 stop:3816 length:1869 start_codon:yes stop_codon:yes gene_type:complete